MVEYSFYTDTYHGGSITSEEWPAAEREASATLERYKRIYYVTAPTPEAESMAICFMADVIAAYGETGPSVSSASVGSVSESYSTGTAGWAAQRSKDVYKAASLYLDIYRGVSR